MVFFMVSIWAPKEYCAVIRGGKMATILFPKKNAHIKVLVTNQPQLKNDD